MPFSPTCDILNFEMLMASMLFCNAVRNSKNVIQNLYSSIIVIEFNRTDNIIQLRNFSTWLSTLFATSQPGDQASSKLLNLATVSAQFATSRPGYQP